jgi:hypothetical protein
MWLLFFAVATIGYQAEKHQQRRPRHKSAGPLDITQ